MSTRKIARFTLIVIILSLFVQVAFSFGDDLPPGVTATFAPGADPGSVYTQTELNIPQSWLEPTHGVGGNSVYRLSPLYSTELILSDHIGYINGPGGVTVYYFPCDPTNFVAFNDAQAQVPRANDLGHIISVTTYNRATGEIVKKDEYCKPTNPAIPAIKPAVLNPPTYGQIWQNVFNQTFIDGSTSSGAYVAPYSPGLTGLPTKFWANFPNGQAIVRDIALPNGFHVNTTARISYVQLNITTPKGHLINIATLYPDPVTGVIATSSYDNPASIYTFKSSGDYVISTGVVWTAQAAVLTGPGGIVATVPLGSIRLSINRNYHVNQLRAGLTQ